MTDEAPSLWREIAKAAWLVSKVILGTAVVLVPIVVIGAHHPFAAIVVLYVMLFAGMIGYFGWQTYRDKLDRQAYRAREREGK